MYWSKCLNHSNHALTCSQTTRNLRHGRSVCCCLRRHGNGYTSTSCGDLITGWPGSLRQATISAPSARTAAPPLTSSPALRSACRASPHAGRRHPAMFQERNQIAGMVGERWMAGWFQHVCSFPDHQSHSPFGSGCTGDTNHAIGGNPASWQLPSEGELQRKAND